MLQESLWSEARIVSAFSVVLLVQGVGAISAPINLTCQHTAHIQAQEFCPRTRFCRCGALSCQLNAQLAPLTWRQSIVVRMFAAIISSHQQRGTQAGPPFCSEFSLERLRITPLDPPVVAMRVAHVLCLRPRGWCLMVRMAGGDVANSNNCSSVHVTTAVGSGVSALPCDSAWQTRGVDISICVGWPVSTSSGVTSMVGWVVGTTCSAA